ncbi:GxxExxY protein [Mongoliitalea daihaiensis]|uniref:GxxExxY protein n=1 Tax=Mongoliitalea daihaiensis TaxID=2782006 RepID=UPI001F3AE352|nr:GxxExxY protein [Mongoliitalea daihaiensis]UJP66907.1 GxxExxY protein [Mongoliitalea daihaiensis]
MTENEIAKIVLDKSFEIHRSLGPGLLESVYEKALEFELNQTKIMVASQVPVPLVYKEVKFESGFRLDLLVENKVIIEIKANEGLAPVHFAQTLTYLKLADKRLGLLINFNVKFLKDGIHRLVNNL